MIFKGIQVSMLKRRVLPTARPHEIPMRGISAKNHEKLPAGPRAENRKQYDMFYDQHLPAHFFSILTVDIADVGESPARAGSKNKNDAGNSEVEELFFKIEDNIT